MEIVIIPATKFSFAFLTLILAASQNANAGLVISNFSGGTTTTGNNNQTQSFNFTVGASDVRLSQLGMFDFMEDGLLVSHEVGIWRNSDGALLSSATIPSGTTATLNARWRMVNVTPIELSANTGYTLGSVTLGDEYTFGSGAAPDGLDATIASLGPLNGRVSPGGSGLSFGLLANSGNRFNANAFVTAVPEPSSISYLACLLLAGLVRRRIKLRNNTTRQA